MTDELLRVRHESARRRKLRVVEKRQLAPGYMSIIFTCDDFTDFVSLSEDDHIKLIVGGAMDEDGRPAMRDYTPRRWNCDTGEFVIEFALHENPGPSTEWAINARPGDCVDIAGPRGSVVIGDGFDWYWLIGDETALPAVSRFLEQRPRASIRAVIAVANEGERIPLNVSPSQIVEWAYRPISMATDSAALIDSVMSQAFPLGKGFVWIAAEAGVAKSLRARIEALDCSAIQLKVKGYWTT